MVVDNLKCKVLRVFFVVMLALEQLLIKRACVSKMHTFTHDATIICFCSACYSLRHITLFDSYFKT